MTKLISILLAISMIACNPLTAIVPSYKLRVEICDTPTKIIGIDVPQINCDMDSLRSWLKPYVSNYDSNVYKLYFKHAIIKRNAASVTITGIGFGLHTNYGFQINREFFIPLSDFEDTELKHVVVNFIILTERG